MESTLRSHWRGKKCLVLLSGGIDSAVALYWAIHKGLEVVGAVTFDYFHRSLKEISATESIARRNAIRLTKIRLPFLKEIVDCVGKIHNQRLKNAPDAYIPARNIIFYGIASHIAEILGANFIVGGHNKDDTLLFPDSSVKFFDKLNAAIKIGLYSEGAACKVILPLSNLTKVQVIRLGASLNVPFEITWSCQTTRRKPCGVCHSCALRSLSFRKAGIEDPLLNQLEIR